MFCNWSYDVYSHFINICMQNWVSFHKDQKQAANEVELGWLEADSYYTQWPVSWGFQINLSSEKNFYIEQEN